MPISRNRTIVALLTGCAISAAPLTFATIVTPAPSWAACDPAPGGAGQEGDCQAPPAAEPVASPPGLPPLPTLSPSDVEVNVTPGQLIPPSVGWSLPQLCLPAFETGIPFVGFQPCI